MKFMAAIRSFEYVNLIVNNADLTKICAMQTCGASDTRLPASSLHGEAENEADRDDDERLPAADLPRRVRERGHGLRTTLMQPSFLSRKVLYMAGPSSRATRWVITNEGSISPFSIRRRSCGR